MMCTYVGATFASASAQGSHVVFTDPEELLLGDAHLRGSDARVGERAEGRWAALGEPTVASAA